MRTRPLGRTGIQVSEIGFGGWAIGGGWGDQRDADSLAALHAAAVSGVISGARNPEQARANAAVGGLAPLSAAQVERLRAHAWLRAWWYGGK